MVGKLSRCLLLSAAFNLSILAIANGGTVPTLGPHREDVDISRYPWSAIGKLYNGVGGACSGAAIAKNKILTAAHCLFDRRKQQFIPAAALHFLLGYRAGRFTAHIRIARYQIGAGFDPLRYRDTIEADWAVLTVAGRLPAQVEPLRLSPIVSPRGTRAMIAGYPQDRAHAMTADRDCELRAKIDDGRLLVHTCRGTRGYSGAPILVSAGGHEMQIAGIQIASLRRNGMEKMVAVPAQAIRARGPNTTGDPWRSTGPSDRKMDAVLAESNGLIRGTMAQFERPRPDDEIGNLIAEIEGRLAVNEIASSGMEAIVVAAP